MKSKLRIIFLIAVIGILCSGCASENRGEEPESEVNKGSIGSESIASGSASEMDTDAGGPDADIPETAAPETTAPETAAPEAIVPDAVTDDWQKIYYERYYTIWDSEEAMLKEIDNRSVYRDNCSFYGDAVYYIEGGGGEYMMKTDISYLVEPLYPTDFVYIEEEDFKDYPPLLLHLLKNEIYARHGYIFRNEDLNNYFRGLIWYTPRYEAKDFDVNVFNEIEVHNLDILARLDTY